MLSLVPFAKLPRFLTSLNYHQIESKNSTTLSIGTRRLATATDQPLYLSRTLGHDGDCSLSSNMPTLGGLAHNMSNFESGS